MVAMFPSFEPPARKSVLSLSRQHRPLFAPRRTGDTGISAGEIRPERRFGHRYFDHPCRLPSCSPPFYLLKWMPGGISSD
ncbi:hypothetical protein ILYODFUR_013757 [Ilyodon furcidens]|uniref:Uncharacterized protein n=1 Tax=Ilyodon furcidens TaxID=33524 RepID=A0ABV0U956_9TELE